MEDMIFNKLLTLKKLRFDVGFLCIIPASILRKACWFTWIIYRRGYLLKIKNLPWN